MTKKKHSFNFYSFFTQSLSSYWVPTAWCRWGMPFKPRWGLPLPGDVVIVRGGTFPEQSVTITKPIRLVREKGSTVTIGGSITLSGVNGDIVLRDFAIDLNGNGKLIIQNCSKVGLEDLTQLPQGVEISNSTVVMRSCQLANLTISGNSDVQVIDSTLANLTTTGSKVQAVNSTMQALSATDSNLTLSAGSTHTTGSITRGQTLYHGTTRQWKCVHQQPPTGGPTAPRSKVP